MKNILFSIIVPIYNVETYLVQCIESILAQTYQNYELILVDDGSPDNCPKICDDYQSQSNKIKVIHKKNGGLVSARQEGALVAKGDYIICVDSDDWITPNYLAIANEILQKYNPDIICFGYYKNTENGTEEVIPLKNIGLYDKNKIREKIFPILFENKYAISFPASIWAKVFKKELYNKFQLQVDKQITMGEDAAVVRPYIYNCSSLYISGECVYHYRYNPTSITKGRKPSNWSGPRLIGENFINSINLENQDLKEQLYRVIVHSVFNVAVSQFNRKEKYNIIAQDINRNLKYELYDEAISNCYFKSFKGKLALYSLKYRLIILMKLYNMIR